MYLWSVSAKIFQTWLQTCTFSPHALLVQLIKFINFADVIQYFGFCYDVALFNEVSWYEADFSTTGSEFCSLILFSNVLLSSKYASWIFVHTFVPFLCNFLYSNTHFYSILRPSKRSPHHLCAHACFSPCVFFGFNCCCISVLISVWCSLYIFSLVERFQFSIALRQK